MNQNFPGEFPPPDESAHNPHSRPDHGRFSPPPLVLSAPEEVGDEDFNRYAYEAFRKEQKKHRRVSIILFLLTFASTFLVGSNYVPLLALRVTTDSKFRQFVEVELARDAIASGKTPLTIKQVLWLETKRGLEYSVPLMLILFCHEMGHYLQSIRHRIPASFPYFIPLPLPPLGTMGAVILQGRGFGDRRQMFDIAVSGPLAGLLVTMPVLYFGILNSEWVPKEATIGAMQLGEPLLLKWMIQWLKPAPFENMEFALNGYAFAGWVGVFLTGMNLLPIGQLDGGHILFTLIGKHAHKVAMIAVGAGIGMMIYSGVYSYALLLILLMMTGIRHPPTANDDIPLGLTRQMIGWATMAFLIIGFTPEPIILQDQGAPKPQQQQQQKPQQQQPEILKERIDPSKIDPDQVVKTFSGNGDTQMSAAEGNGASRQTAG